VYIACVLSHVCMYLAHMHIHMHVGMSSTIIMADLQITRTHARAFTHTHKHTPVGRYQNLKGTAPAEVPRGTPRAASCTVHPLSQNSDFHSLPRSLSLARSLLRPTAQSGRLVIPWHQPLQRVRDSRLCSFSNVSALEYVTGLFWHYDRSLLMVSPM